MSEARFPVHVLGPNDAPWCAGIMRSDREHASLQERLADRDLMFTVAAGAPALVTMPVARWIDLLRAAGSPRPIRCVS